ncbi:MULTISPECIES: response regulator transcription factor [Paenibacillus]|uniref:response regulator transcription factor n=1 Tax=Paenibacillus TaxID=44249 RepID=UPI000B89C4D9|nr:MULTISPECIES: response regulator transcription factor [Paenibacillus]PRA03349.1 DNA-binding response regulator [Paenibacillus sp. MYb63]PRA46767.1 DNA-binding response regulator [Paenibacillus sp. MYb67]QZN76513.1 response regulator transcription factor [Paenibacillus sp. DR312]
MSERNDVNNKNDSGQLPLIRLILADDDYFIRESLKVLLGLDSGIRVTGTASNGQEALELLEAGTPADVVLMDIRMPECDGVEGTKRIKSRFPEIQVLMLTTFDDDEYIIQALQDGASGYLLKNVPPERIIQGIKTVHNGDMLIHPDIARKLTGLLRPATTPLTQNPIEAYGLTRMELAVAEAISEGLSNKEIAAKLFLSEGTVKNYVTDILGKLSLRDRTQIAIFMLKQ